MDFREVRTATNVILSKKVKEQNQISNRKTSLFCSNHFRILSDICKICSTMVTTMVYFYFLKFSSLNSINVQF